MCIKSVAKYSYPVFNDAEIGDTVSFIVKNENVKNKNISLLICNNKDDTLQKHQLIDVNLFVSSDGTYKLSINNIPNKVFENITLNDIANIVVGIKAYQTGKGVPK